MMNIERAAAAGRAGRWTIWAALLLGLLFLGLGAPLIAHHGPVAERAAQTQPNG